MDLKPISSSAITTTVPDIMLQKHATIVATITARKRPVVIQRPRMMLRMMMKGAAKASSGTAANVDGYGPRCSRRKLAGRLVIA